MTVETTDQPLIRVMALHALAYCERLYYLEEVEEIRVADARVYAGRTLHEGLDKDAEWKTVMLESEAWGIKGKVDYARYRDGELVVVEHKRGRSKGDEAWESDELQVIAYTVLLSEHLGRDVAQGRIRYHANKKTVRVEIDDDAKDRLRRAINRARELSQAIERPPVAENENLCAHCSLAPVCLPEEERLLRLTDSDEAPRPQRLFPADDERRVVHVTEVGSRVGRSGHQIVITPRDGDKIRLPGKDVCAVVLHGGVQISSQLVQYAAANNIAVHWLSRGGAYIGGVAPAGGVHRRLRQYKGLSNEGLCLQLARRLAQAKVENQLKFLIRSARNRNKLEDVTEYTKAIRAELRGISRAEGFDTLRGHEGIAGRSYFAALPHLIDESQSLMAFSGRTRRPPQDAFNAALSFGYSLLYRDVMAATIVVGLDPAIGFFHRPRSAAYPLALDLMELFRVVLWDLPLIASINRRQWSEEHFTTTKRQVWLSNEGRKLAITIYESRKQEHWKHPVLGYSLSYSRAMELEARLLEKEWAGSPGLFGNMRIR